MLTLSEPSPSSTLFTKANAHADRAIAFAIHIQHPLAIRVARYPTIILIKHGINTSCIYRVGHIIISMECITSCMSHKAFANTTSMSTIQAYNVTLKETHALLTIKRNQHRHAITIPHVPYLNQVGSSKQRGT